MLTELSRCDVILYVVPVYFIFIIISIFSEHFFILIIVIISMFYNFLPSIKCSARASFIQCLALLKIVLYMNESLEIWL